MIGYRRVVQHLPDDQPLFGVRIRDAVLGQNNTRPIEDLAANYLSAIRRAQDHGPYYLLGYSAAGLIAFEVARRLVNAGEEVAFLGLLDTRCPGWHETAPHFIRRHARSLSNLGMKEIVPYLTGCVTRNALPWKEQLRTRFHAVLGVTTPWRIGTNDLPTTNALPSYVPRWYPGKLTLFLAAEPPGTCTSSWRLAGNDSRVEDSRLGSFPAITRACSGLRTVKRSLGH